MHKLTVVLMLTVVMLMFTTLGVIVFATDNSSGQVTIGAVTPAISSPKLLNTTNVSVNATFLDVNTEYWINATVNEDSTMQYLKNVTFVLWDAQLANSSSPDAEQSHYTFAWDEASSSWSGSPFSFLFLSDCVDPGVNSSLQTFVFRCAFALSKVAHEENLTDWRINIVLTDDSNGVSADSELAFGVSFYSEINVIDSTHSFGSLNPGDANVPVIDQPLNISVLANNYYTVQAKSANASLTGPLGHTIPVGSVAVDGADNVSEAASLTTNYTDVNRLEDLTPPTLEASPIVNENPYLWISVPNPQYPGTYTYTLYLQISRSPMLVKFQSLGLGSYGPVLNVDNATYDADYFHSHGYEVLIYWPVGSTHTFEWYGIVANASFSDGERYVASGGVQSGV